MTLRYPSEISSGDTITFTAHEYRTNGPTGVNAGRGDGPAQGPPIVLYVPNSTPAMQNGQRWEKASFEGPFGEMKRDVTAAIVKGAGGEIGTREDPGKFPGTYGVVEGLGEAVNQINRIPDAARQGIIEFASKNFVNTSANQMMAYSRGEIFNPNIELLYDGPGLRSFGLNFSFIPKDAAEARTVMDIITEFKIWSTPEDQGTKYKIPCVWKIKYGGQGGDWMNKFKRAACTNIAVQYNAGLDMHATYENGCPIRTDIQLSFHEVEVITRKDHRDNRAGGGY